MPAREQVQEDVNGFGRLMSVLLVLALMIANSLLFYFVIWDMLSPSDPFSVILFFISGGAHLTYFFLPWFIRDQLAPMFRVMSEPGSGVDFGAAEGGSFFVKLCTQFGVALCLSALALWAVQQDFPWSKKKPEAPPLITAANCEKIGGKPVYVKGRLSCVIPVRPGNGTASPSAPATATTPTAPATTPTAPADTAN